MALEGKLCDCLPVAVKEFVASISPRACCGCGSEGETLEILIGFPCMDLSLFFHEFEVRICSNFMKNRECYSKFYKAMKRSRYGVYWLLPGSIFGNDRAELTHLVQRRFFHEEKCSNPKCRLRKLKGGNFENCGGCKRGYCCKKCQEEDKDSHAKECKEPMKKPSVEERMKKGETEGRWEKWEDLSEEERREVEAYVEKMKTQKEKMAKGRKG